MKPFHSFAMLAAIAAVGQAFAVDATTTPVGYTTQTLKPNIANLIGLNIQGTTVAAGVIDAKSTNSITDNEVNFTSALTAGSTYILEITGAPGAGVVQEIATWSGSVLTTPSDLTSYVTTGSTTYKLRKAQTITDVFGLNNSAGLTASPDGDATIADNVLVLNAAGTAFDTIFFYNDGVSTGWFDLDFNDAKNRALIYADALYVRRVGGSDINLVVSGEVKTTSTSNVLLPGNNFVGSVYPVGSTLANSGLSAGLTASPDGSTTSADTVLLQKPDGSYGTYLYYNDGVSFGWYDLDFNPSDAVALTAGMVIQNKGTTKAVTLTPPSNYSTL